MPTYGFKCKNCDQGYFEVTHRFTEPHPTECPKCQGEIVRVYHSPVIHYHGSGFTATDSVLDEPTEDEIIEDKLDRLLEGKSED